MRIQLDADTDKKLNDAIKAQPKMLDELQAKYELTDHSIEALVEVLSAKYREIIAS
jgi:bacterioferritin-associated ferredoxin